MRKSGLFEIALQKSLPAEVLKGGIFRRVGDAYVDHAGNRSTTRRAEEGARVLDCLRVAEVGLIEANPIGVVQDLGTFQGTREPLGMVEVEGMYVDSIPERMLAIWRIGEGPDAVLARFQWHALLPRRGNFGAGARTVRPKPKRAVTLSPPPSRRMLRRWTSKEKGVPFLA